MTRSEAEELARINAREHSDRETHRWMAKEQVDGSWAVVKVRMPTGLKVDPLKTTTGGRLR